MHRNHLIKNNLLICLFILLLFCLLIMPSFSVRATEQSDAIVLGKHYDILRDSSKTITIEGIINGTHADAFTASEEDYLLFWHTDDTIWLRLSTENLLQKEQKYWIEVIDKLDKIEMFFVKQDGSYHVEKRGIANLSTQKIQFRSNLFSITDPSIKEIYIKLDGGLPLSMISYLYTEDGFINKVISYKYFSGIFYGFLFALLIYNLFLYFSLKERAYFYYVLYTFSFILYQATMNSLDIELAGQLFPKWFFMKSLVISVDFLLLCMLLFSMEFLELKKYLPRFYQVSKLLIGVIFVSFIVALFVSSVEAVNDFATVLSIFVLSFLWLSGLLVWLKGHKMARFYMIGWTVLLSSVIIQALSFLSIIPFHPNIFEHIPAIGAMFESILLSLALADKINLIKQEHHTMQKTLNDMLESKVQARTQQLEQAKMELEKLANTDRLTQIANRVRLDTILEQQFELAIQHHTPFSIILLDIDNFKAVNDEFGHQIGDTVLIEVAKLLTNVIRTQDTVGRWGGEEFLVICPQTSLEEALQLAEKLRQQLGNHVFPVVQHKTSSFGVTCYQEKDTLHTLLSRCDVALYQAKKNGRNRVEFRQEQQLS
ncbi:sensor domain-containing diguanylate cyclase [Lysinibacillus piscis]|uniref:GGDEF domain-containing protein n=1 Tax=Lysinibacillus piscis TaxID=2518931 RepID=A0ABQ5NG75_9BACI|nr:diguanylate cyclase [Lysinibacillus sp. KH24]GLC87036.1 hypothetical protein LYSBPC_01630 [Lysinibacillus sp. KH24]